MYLFQQSSTGTISEMKQERFPLEKDIQTLIEANLAEIFNLQFVASELTVEKFRIDTLAFDEDSNSFVIIEYKKGNSYSVVDQGYSYLSVMLNNKADFILEYNERLDQSLRRDDVDWSASRVIFVSPSFNAYQKNSVNFRDIPFELWEIRRFEGGVISLVQHQASSNEDINLIADTNPESPIKQVSSEVKVYREVDHTASASAETLEVFNALKEELSGWDDVTCTAMKYYVGFKKGNSLFAAVRIFKNHLSIDFSRGQISPDGHKSKNFFTVDDPKNTLEAKSWNHKNGRVGNSYVLKLSKASDLEYAKYLIKQKYDSL
jgi:predicted transport protein